ncbi:hypothetical protein DYB30_012129 [Aphanomyces astaci]|uniref:Transcription elongation factor Eaf N-terminal domain-containing protein n=1 Tax=Aphanomyces astaci TaxID=112090 RepID=A0A397CST6_APHAT|nr:hypothetical protein DYB30_012129 [Aphanomyces astaci]
MNQQRREKRLESEVNRDRSRLLSARNLVYAPPPQQQTTASGSAAMLHHHHHPNYPNYPPPPPTTYQQHSSFQQPPPGYAAAHPSLEPPPGGASAAKPPTAPPAAAPTSSKDVENSHSNIKTEVVASTPHNGTMKREHSLAMMHDKDALPRISSVDSFSSMFPRIASLDCFQSLSSHRPPPHHPPPSQHHHSLYRSPSLECLNTIPRVGSLEQFSNFIANMPPEPTDDADGDVDVQCSFRYEFQPASVDTRVPGLVRTDSTANSMVVEVAHANAPGGIEFKGKVTENKDVECVLIFDSATQTFTLEKLPLSCAQLRVLSLLWLHVFAPPPPTTEMQLRAFEAWIRQHGGRIGNVQLAAFPGMGIGVQTTSDITEKDEVLYLPRDLVICRDTVTKQLPREFLRTGPHADDDLLATFLLLERLKGPASKWAPYLAALIQLIGDAKRSTTAAFKALLRKLSAVLKKRKASLSLDDYIWATSVLGSRALTIQGVRYLVPFADMFNGQSHPVYCAYPLFTLDIVGWAILQALVLTDGDAQTCATTHTCLEFESPGKVMTHADAAAWVLAAATAALQVLSVG